MNKVLYAWTKCSESISASAKSILYTCTCTVVRRRFSYVILKISSNKCKFREFSKMYVFNKTMCNCEINIWIAYSCSMTVSFKELLEESKYILVSQASIWLEIGKK